MIADLIKISRPRFWLYTGGTFALGAVAATNSVYTIIDPVFIWFFLVFLLPANIFIYGVNDLADRDTDKFNKKKGSKEVLLQKRHQQTVAVAVSISLGILLLSALYVKTGLAWMAGFLIIGAAYSLKPLRLKAKPFVDSLSNVFYTFAGFFGYTLFGGDSFSWIIFASVWAWTAAMHLYSAVPDISADRSAGLKTTAVILGNYALFACAFLWLIFSAGMISYFGLYALPTLIYVCIPLFVYANINLAERVYWYFPWLNALFGGIGFWLLV